MSAGRACSHRPRADHVVVTAREGNRSAFNGYRWAPSAWSAVLCLTCGARWRSRARWVAECRDATEDEALGLSPKNHEFADDGSAEDLRPLASHVS